MSTKELISEIKKLPYKYRLKVIELALKSLEETDEDRLEKAARLLSKDYKTNRDLTAFTVLDVENFYEAR